MDTPYKLQFTLPNGATFSAEGPQDIVQQAFERFLSSTEHAPTAAPKEQKPQHGSPLNDTNIHPDQADQTLLSRAYLPDPAKAIVSLRALPAEGPNKASDAAIMILYGAQQLLHIAEYPVTRLKKSLQKSGIQVGRVDRLMEPYRHILIKGGAGVSGKYSLNNQGVIQVISLLRTIFT